MARAPEHALAETRAKLRDAIRRAEEAVLRIHESQAKMHSRRQLTETDEERPPK